MAENRESISEIKESLWKAEQEEDKPTDEEIVQAVAEVTIRKLGRLDTEAYWVAKNDIIRSVRELIANKIPYEKISEDFVNEILATKSPWKSLYICNMPVKEMIEYEIIRDKERRLEEYLEPTWG